MHVYSKNGENIEGISWVEGQLAAPSWDLSSSSLQNLPFAPVEQTARTNQRLFTEIVD